MRPVRPGWGAAEIRMLGWIGWQAPAGDSPVWRLPLPEHGCTLLLSEDCGTGELRRVRRAPVRCAGCPEVAADTQLRVPAPVQDPPSPSNSNPKLR